MCSKWRPKNTEKLELMILITELMLWNNISLAHFYQDNWKPYFWLVRIIVFANHLHYSCESCWVNDAACGCGSCWKTVNNSHQKRKGDEYFCSSQALILYPPLILVKIVMHKWEKNWGRKMKGVPLSTTPMLQGSSYFLSPPKYLPSKNKVILHAVKDLYSPAFSWPHSVD